VNHECAASKAFLKITGIIRRTLRQAQGRLPEIFPASSFFAKQSL